MHLQSQTLTILPIQGCQCFGWCWCQLGPWTQKRTAWSWRSCHSWGKTKKIKEYLHMHRKCITTILHVIFWVIVLFILSVNLIWVVPTMRSNPHTRSTVHLCLGIHSEIFFTTNHDETLESHASKTISLLPHLPFCSNDSSDSGLVTGLCWTVGFLPRCGSLVGPQ